MNAAPPVTHAAIGPAPEKSPKSAGGSQEFAAALVSAGARPARKPGGGMRPDGNVIGAQLPGPGNLAPPPPCAVAAHVRAAPADALALGTTSATSSPGTTGDLRAGLIDAAAIPAPVGVADPSALNELPQPPATPAGVAGAAAGGTSTPATPAPAADASPFAVLAGAKSSAAAPGSSASAAGAKPISADAATAETSAATSRPNSADGSAAAATTADASMGADGTAQASSAAMSAAAAGVIVSSNVEFAGAADSPSLPTNESPTPPAGATRQGNRANSAVALAASPARPAGDAAPTGNAQMTTAPADASSDKHASGGGANSALLGTSGDSAAAALQLNVNTASSTDAASTVAPTIAAGVDTPEFGQELAGRVSWMVDNNLNGAKLQVNPPQLGPIEVRIALQGNHAQVWLTSHSAVTRDALESSSPKLREMLGAQGFGQVSVDISQRSFQERSAHPQPYEWTPSANPSSTAALRADARPLPRTSSGAVDAYA